MIIEFNYPIYSLLFLLVAISAFLFFKYMKLPTYKKVQLTIIRLVILTLLVLALMGMNAVFTSKDTHYVFLVDRSASVDASETWIVQEINKMKNKLTDTDVFSVISFTNDVAIELLSVNKNEDFIGFKQQLEESDTNIENALTFAQQIIQSSNLNGKIVLLSDGNETIGKYVDSTALLQKSGVIVDVLPIETNEREDIAITDLQASKIVYQGETIHLDATVHSSVNMDAVIRWKVNHQVVATTPVQLSKGNNMFRFNYPVDKEGFVNFTAEISGQEEAFIENNTMSTIAIIKSTPKVLAVYENESFISNYISNQEYAVDVVHVSQLYDSLSKYLEYESIIFENTSGVSISSKQMDLIHQAVYDYGVGFIMTGGDASFGLGGYFQSPIEKLLPVDMDIKGKKELPSLGLILLVDRSGSMSNGKLELAKEAAVRSIEMLREEDTFGFIAFDDRPWQIVETAPIVDKESVISDVSSVSLGGGTDFQEALAQAVKQLDSADVQRKHVILLTDGQAPTDRVTSIIEDAKGKNISLSTVAIGADADQMMLETMASSGNGRYYFVSDATVIPTILSRETAMMTRTYIEDNPFYPTVVGRSFITNLANDGLPQMNAYIATSIKPTAKLQMISSKEDPLFATWQYGLGTTIAFTSDISGKWVGDWVNWNKWQNFLDMMVRSTFLPVDTEDMVTTFRTEGNMKKITIETTSNSFSNISASLVSDKGEKVPISPIVQDIGKYEVLVPSKEGIYYLNLTETSTDGTVKNYLSGFTIPYSEEYVAASVNNDVLGNISSTLKGKQIEDSNSFQPLTTYSKKSMQPLTEYLLLTAFLLFFTEIAMRRFNKFLPVIRWKKKEKASIAIKVKEQATIKTKPTAILDSVESPIDEKASDVKSKQDKLNDLLNATKRNK